MPSSGFQSLGLNANAGLTPWAAEWGCGTLASLLLGALRADTWNAAGTVASANTVNVFPRRGGVIRLLSLRFAGGIAAGQDTTWSLLVNGVPSVPAMSFVLTAAAGPNQLQGEADAAVVLPAAATPYLIDVQWTAPANPGAGNTAPRAFACGWVNP